MKSSTHLFLFGSGPPFTPKLAEQFKSLARGSKIAVLYIEREGAAEYLPRYTNCLGISDPEIFYLPLGDEYSQEDIAVLESADAIVIGGGDTVLYRKFIVETSVGEIVRKLFEQGRPLAGFSAGALISPEECVISPNDNIQEVQLFEKGLGLLPDTVVSAHYLEWEEELNLKKAVQKTEVTKGYGIAESSGVYLKNGRLSDIEGYIHIENKN
ncbi:Type 1 glutamine amidotransferase-like domain-containing protein [Halobacillus sp. K22]|uniref:Type 1 glutamine amidotransferase-like domain-containing protein n=1 Tax=Halobacillus sp. K22 TaxID=3457431 RepID=UPI003FCC9FB3